jgi:hypothetical protein
MRRLFRDPIRHPNITFPSSFRIVKNRDMRGFTEDKKAFEESYRTLSSITADHARIGQETPQFIRDLIFENRAKYNQLIGRITKLRKRYTVRSKKRTKAILQNNNASKYRHRTIGHRCIMSDDLIKNLSKGSRGFFLHFSKTDRYVVRTTQEFMKLLVRASEFGTLEIGCDDKKSDQIIVDAIRLNRCFVKHYQYIQRCIDKAAIWWNQMINKPMNHLRQQKLEQVLVVVKQVCQSVHKLVDMIRSLVNRMPGLSNFLAGRIVDSMIRDVTTVLHDFVILDERVAAAKIQVTRISETKIRHMDGRLICRRHGGLEHRLALLRQLLDRMITNKTSIQIVQRHVKQMIHMRSWLLNHQRKSFNKFNPQTISQVNQTWAKMLEAYPELRCPDIPSRLFHALSVKVGDPKSMPDILDPVIGEEIPYNTTYSACDGKCRMPFDGAMEQLAPLLETGKCHIVKKMTRGAKFTYILVSVCSMCRKRVQIMSMCESLPTKAPSSVLVDKSGIPLTDRADIDIACKIWTDGRQRLIRSSHYQLKCLTRIHKFVDKYAGPMPKREFRKIVSECSFPACATHPDGFMYSGTNGIKECKACGIKPCPQARCDGSFDLPPGHTGISHNTKSCATYRIEVAGKEGGDEAATRIYMEQCPKCPACKTGVELRDGCNHITCPTLGCGAHWCIYKYLATGKYCLEMSMDPDIIYRHMAAAHGDIYQNQHAAMLAPDGPVQAIDMVPVIVAVNYPPRAEW